MQQCQLHNIKGKITKEKNLFDEDRFVFRCPKGCIYTSPDYVHWKVIVTVNGNKK